MNFQTILRETLRLLRKELRAFNLSKLTPATEEKWLGPPCILLQPHTTSGGLVCSWQVPKVSRSYCKGLVARGPPLTLFFSKISLASKDFPGDPVVKTLCFHCVGAWIWFLVGELRPHMVHGMPKERRKERREGGKGGRERKRKTQQWKLEAFSHVFKNKNFFSAIFDTLS